MKTLILFIGLSLSASAQNIPFVWHDSYKTNVTKVPAQNITAAHEIVRIGEVVQVGKIVNGQLVIAEQPAIFLVSQVTNLVDKSLVQKPLLSAQRQRPLPQSVAKAPPPRRDVSTNVLTAKDVTNSIPYRRAPPFDK